MKLGSSPFLRFTCILSILLCPLFVFSQLFLQIERINSVERIKLESGDFVSYELKEYPGSWHFDHITEILPQDTVIFFTRALVHLDEIKTIRYEIKWSKILGRQLMHFGVAWLVMGGVIDLYDSSFSYGWDTVAIGGSGILLGYLIKTIFKYKTFKIGKKWRLRIIDVRFPTDPYSGKT